MSTTRSGGGKTRGDRRKPAPPPNPPTTRQQWDQACARFVDAVMTDQPDAAHVAYAEALVFLSRIELAP